jgi:uncharacterized phage-associated protein
MIDFAYDAERAHNVALWLLKRHGHLEHIKLLKLVVLADLEHLAKYGRPIVGGQYFAMEHGPVASELYDDLKMGIEGTAPISVGSYVVKAVVEPDEDYLSETDLEVLKQIDDQFGAWDVYRLSDYTHTDAWKKNYKGNNGAYPIPYEDFLRERLDANSLAIVRDSQEGERILG